MASSVPKNKYKETAMYLYGTLTFWFGEIRLLVVLLPRK